MIISTTGSIEGKKIIKYLGIVSGNVVTGINVYKDIFAKIADVLGGRSRAYEKELKKAREIALQSMKEEAQKLGANAIVGVNFDCEVVGEKGSMLLVTATGTAVIVEDIK